jgi:hypothetical protein
MNRGAGASRPRIGRASRWARPGSGGTRAGTRSRGRLRYGFLVPLGNHRIQEASRETSRIRSCFGPGLASGWLPL